jgi:hypothetical protein
VTATSAPARPASVSRAHVTPPLSFARLLGIEVRRSPMPLILPLVAALFWFDSYRPSTSQAPFYPLVTFWNMGQGHTIIDFGPFVAGMAAWIGSRDGRRGTADLITATPCPRWVAQLAAWAAAAIWAVAAYLVFVGVMFAVYAQRGVQGGPPWWWVAVGATAVAAFSAGGFAVGVLVPNRFAAPLAAFAAFLALIMSSQTGFKDTSGWALVLPTNSNGNFQLDSGIFYPYLPDLPIARIVFLAGLAIAALGLAGLPAAAGERRIRIVAAIVAAAGVGVAGTGAGLASSARLGPHGMVISALHDAASDRPILYHPVCGGSVFRVCLDPVYRSYLADVIAALTPVAGQVAGLPGAPVRAAQAGAVYTAGEGGSGQTMTITGRPAVLSVTLGGYGFLPGPTGFSSRPTNMTTFDQSMWVLFFDAFTGAGDTGGTSVQRAVTAALLAGAGVPFGQLPGLLSQVAGWPPPGPSAANGPVYTAARRFAALSVSVRQAWLTEHLASIRAGGLNLQQLP